MWGSTESSGVGYLIDYTPLQGTSAGKAHGFVITSLPSLSDTLANVGRKRAKVNFVHYLALVREICELFNLRFIKNWIYKE